MKRKLLILTILVMIMSLLMGCSLPAVAQEETASAQISDVKSIDQSVDDSGASAEGQIERPVGWNESTHDKDTEPDYEIVFPQDEVNRIDISISAENWQVMQDDMTDKFGAFGTKSNDRMGGEPDGQKPQMPEGRQPQPLQDGEIPAQPNRPMEGGGGLMEADESNPVWVPVTIAFEGDTWTSVGLRFKGNSSLKNSWSSGSLKIPFKLDFDEFEDEYPEIDDQRFYGFKQLSLASNFNDDSLSREKVVSEIFSEAGVPSARTAFYQVYVDFGEGPTYFGLYTMVEVIDDTVIETQFEDDSGNVYKPSGTGATFAAGSFSDVSFDKETNQDEEDYSDILALYDALHAEIRTTDPTTWRANLESVFDVSGFLDYLAVNTIVQNWDTYGLMNHNYYLYHDPTTDLLTWIPWDNNEAMKTGRMREPLSFGMDEVTEKWPLIRFLLDDPVYQAEYLGYLEAAINGPLNPVSLSARLEDVHELLRPYVIGSDGENSGDATIKSEIAFDSALRELIQHVENRYEATRSYLISLE